MNWGLLAGGLSRGLEQGLAGTNQGLLEGENIRRGRAQEAMTQAHFDMSRQQMMNAMANQAFQQALGLRHADLQERQLGEQSRLHDWTMARGAEDLALARAKEAREAAMSPYHMDELRAKANWYGLRPELMDQRNRISQEWHRGQVAAAMARIGMMNKRIDAQMNHWNNLEKTQGVKVDPRLKQEVATIGAKMQNARMLLGTVERNNASGIVNPNLPTAKDLVAELEQYEQQLDTLTQQFPQAGGVQQPGAAGPGTGAPTPQDIRLRMRQRGFAY